jgi:hypothetical protein
MTMSSNVNPENPIEARQTPANTTSCFSNDSNVLNNRVEYSLVDLLFSNDAPNVISTSSETVNVNMISFGSYVKENEQEQSHACYVRKSSLAMIKCQKEKKKDCTLGKREKKRNSRIFTSR